MQLVSHIILSNIKQKYIDENVLYIYFIYIYICMCVLFLAMNVLYALIQVSVKNKTSWENYNADTVRREFCPGLNYCDRRFVHEWKKCLFRESFRPLNGACLVAHVSSEVQRWLRCSVIFHVFVNLSGTGYTRYGRTNFTFISVKPVILVSKRRKKRTIHLDRSKSKYLPNN